MRNKSLFLSVIFSVVGLSQAHALEHTEKLLTLANTKYTDSFAEILMVSDETNQNIAGLRYVSKKKGVQTGFKNLGLAQLKNADGVVVDQYEDYKVLSIRGTVDAKANKGVLTLRYLNNGMFMSYEECTAQLVRDSAPGSQWKLVGPKKDVVTNASMVVGAMGVQTIQGLCK